MIGTHINNASQVNVESVVMKGHLIASVFNGPGERLNLLPMNGNLNKGAWKAMENS